MAVLQSGFETSGAEAAANRAAWAALAEELQARRAEASSGGPVRARERPLARGKLLPRDRVMRLLDPGSPFLELSPLAAHGMYEGDIHGASIITGVGRVSGREAMIVANDSTIKGAGQMGVVKTADAAGTVYLDNFNVYSAGSGTTTIDGGGSCGCGVVYSITTAGAENVIYAFQGGSDGNGPWGLIDLNGTLYGTTYLGGNCNANCGTIFSISTTGAEKVIYRFAGGADGEQPEAALIDVNGVLYGTTSEGGESGSCFQVNGNCGTIFSVTTAGAESVLYTFVGGTDGWSPETALTNLNGTLYGTTYYGGDHDVCCVVYGYGTVFALTP